MKDTQEPVVQQDLMVGVNLVLWLVVIRKMLCTNSLFGDILCGDFQPFGTHVAEDELNQYAFPHQNTFHISTTNRSLSCFLQTLLKTCTVPVFDPSFMFRFGSGTALLTLSRWNG